MNEDFEERAAIMEYDGGLSREEAEAKARICTEAGKGYKSVAFVSERIHTETDCEIGKDSIEFRAKLRER